MKDELNSIEAVSRAVDRIKRRGRVADFELSNGIVLTVKPVPPLLLQAVAKEYEAPLPPKVWMEDKGREEENPNHPDYIRELEKLEENSTLALNDLVLAVGTSFKSAPEGYYSPEDDGWIKEVEYAAKISGTELHIDKEDEVKRYLCWLRFYALETTPDVVLAQNLSHQLAGLREGEIDEVVASFRGIQERGTDPEYPSPNGSENGDRANRASRRAGAGNRRA